MDEVEELIEKLKSGDGYDAIRSAAFFLGELKDKRAVPALIERLGDKDWDVREGAAWALGKIGDASAVGPLISVLKDKELLVSEAAVEALVKIGEPAISALSETLKDEIRGVRQNAVRALGKIGKPAVPTLIEMVGDEDWDVRKGAAWALKEIVTKCKTIEELKKIEKDIGEGSVALKKGRVVKGILIDAQMLLANLTREIARAKDELAPERDLLLTDKPKPPKKGRGVYRTLRMNVLR